MSIARRLFSSSSSSSVIIKTSLPGPKSSLLLQERLKYVTDALNRPSHGLFFESGKGAILKDVDGNQFIDFGGGIGVLNVGHCDDRVVQRAHTQLDKLMHSCMMVFPYPSYVALCKKLCEIAPFSKDVPLKAALFNTGSEAVENAVKIARYFTGRPATLVFDGAFHGRTLLASAMTSKVTPYRDGFGPFPSDVYKISLPDTLRRCRGAREEDVIAQAIESFHHLLKSTVSPASVACCVIEPVLGEGGFLVPPPDFLKEIQRVCREESILIIADEVQSGFGRTGEMFASPRQGIEPDLVTMAKSLSSGLPISAVVGREEIMDTLQQGAMGGTFGGNPVACEAALGVIEVLEDGLLQRSKELGARAKQAFDALQDEFDFVGDSRGVGAMRALEIVTCKETMVPDKERTNAIIDYALQRGLLLLPSGLHGNVIRTLFPFSITDNQFEEAMNILNDSFKNTIK